jgi:hypothetical protein
MLHVIGPLVTPSYIHSGCYFFVDKDLKEFSSFKLDKVGQSILNILRHCGKLKEVRGGKIVRFVVVPA